MKKLLLIAIAGLVSTSASWGLSFSWQNGGPVGSTEVKITQNGRAFGGDVGRFFPHGGAGTSVDLAADGLDHVGPGGPPPVAAGTGLGDFVSIFSIDAIRDKIFNTTFFDANSDFQIVGVFFGAEDHTGVYGVDGATDFIKVSSTGGRMELYLVDDLPAFGTPMLSDIGVDGDGTIIFPGVTDGTPFVAFDLITKSNGFTDEREINMTTPDDSAHNVGAFFASVDDTWDNYDVYGLAFDTNSIDSASEGVAGADLQVDYVMNVIGPPAGSLPLAFDGPSFGAIQPIPEPSTLLLLGTGLLGMVGYARRRRS